MSKNIPVMHVLLDHSATETKSESNPKLINHEGEGDSDHQADEGILTISYCQDPVKKRTGQAW